MPTQSSESETIHSENPYPGPLRYAEFALEDWARVLYLTALVTLLFSLFELLRLIERLHMLPSLTLYYSGGAMWRNLVAAFADLFNAVCGTLMGIASLAVLNRSTPAQKWVARFAIGMLICEGILLFSPPYSFWTTLISRQRSEGLIGLLSSIDAALYIELPHILMLLLIIIVMTRGRFRST